MKLLFLCVANSARSQIAEGLARKLLPEADVRSAGSNPGKLNPYAIAVLREVGLDISSHHSKSTDDLPPEFLQELDYAITLCAEEVCPILVSRAKKLHWPHPDPAGVVSQAEEDHLQAFRQTRDSIQRCIEDFKKGLDP